MLETDPKEITKERKAAQMRRSKLLRQSLKNGTTVTSPQGARDTGKMDEFRGDQNSESSSEDIPINQRLDTELDEFVDEIEFKEKESNATCRFSEIEGIIFGGMSSRFWMLRKHINSLDAESLKKLPFYSWNCVTL